MKSSEYREEAKRQAFVQKQRPVQAGDNLAGNQFARPEWQAMVESGDGAMARLAAAHGAFWQGHQNLRAAADSHDPEMTPDAHFMRTRKLGDEWLKRSGEQAMMALQTAKTAIEAERRDMVSELGLVEDHRAAEVRSILRGLSDAERMSVLQDAVNEREARTIAAVTEAPAYLSGVTRDQAAAVRRQYELRHGAKRLSRIDALKKAVEIVDQTISEAVVFQAFLHPEHRAAEIEAKQRAAREVQQRLSRV